MLPKMTTPTPRITNKAVILRDCITLREAVELENRDTNGTYLGIGDITEEVGDWIPSLSCRLLDAVEEGFEVDDLLIQNGFLFMHEKETNERRLYLNRQQYLVLQSTVKDPRWLANVH